MLYIGAHSILKWIVLYLQLLTSIIGLYGAIWVIRQYHRGTILRNIPGQIIYSIAYTDIIHGLYYILWFFVDGYYIDMRGNPDTTQFMYDFTEGIFIWGTFPCCLLGILLSLNTLYIVRFHGSSAQLERFKYLAIVIAFLCPIPIYFLPVSYWRQQTIFITTSMIYEPPATANQGAQLFLQLGFVSVGIFCSLLAYAIIAWDLRRMQQEFVEVGSNMISVAQKKIMKLVMVYSISIIISWIPWMIRFLIVRVIHQSGDSKFLRDFNAVTLVIFFRSLVFPARGYIHAQAVLYVFNTVKHRPSPFSLNTLLSCILLISPKESDASRAESPAQDSLVNAPQWDFTFKDEPVPQSITIPREFDSAADSYR
jgi:hypothetical protein